MRIIGGDVQPASEDFVPTLPREQLARWVVDAVTCRLYNAGHSPFDVGAGYAPTSFPSWAMNRVEGALWRAQEILSPGSLCLVRRVGPSTLLLGADAGPHDRLPPAAPDDLWVEVVAIVPDAEDGLPGIDALEAASATLAATRDARRQGRFVVLALALGATRLDIIEHVLKERTQTHRWTELIVRRPDSTYVPIEIVAWEI